MGEAMYVWGRGYMEILVFSSEFCREPKTARKMKVLKNLTPHIVFLILLNPVYVDLK